MRVVIQLLMAFVACLMLMGWAAFGLPSCHWELPGKEKAPAEESVGG